MTHVRCELIFSYHVGAVGGLSRNSLEVGKVQQRIGTMSNDGVNVKAANHVKVDVIDEAPDGYLYSPVCFTLAPQQQSIFG